MVINLIITIGLLELYARLTQPIGLLLVVKLTIDRLVRPAPIDPKQPFMHNFMNSKADQGKHNPLL